MYTARHTRPRDTSDTSKDEVLNAVIRAIHTLPKQKEGKQDPILEPHYKLVSIVHKLVGQNELTVSGAPSLAEIANSTKPRDACTVLQATPYARKLPPVDDIGHWKQYILGVLKALRTADKANWHHRIIARVSTQSLLPATSTDPTSPLTSCTTKCPMLLLRIAPDMS